MKTICPSCSKDLYVTQSDPDDTEVLCGACGHVFDLFDEDGTTLTIQTVERSPHELTPKQRDTKVCPYCAETVKIDARVCKHCGYTIDQQLKSHQDYERRMTQAGISRTAFILLGLFVGGLGVHNFCAGYVGRGITQLLLTLLSCGWLWFIVFFWNIIEVCVVDTDASGRRMS